MANTLNPIDAFAGDFEFLPLAAQLRYGAVPTHPTSENFQCAAVTVADDLDCYAEAHWHIEAVRERRLNPGRALDDAALREIGARVAKRLYARAMEVA
jgi:hypothetical protein